MADGQSYTSRMHPDDIAELARAMARGVAAAPPAPDRPPADATGRDALFFREIVHDECEKLYDRFKTDQERLFRRLRMPIDEDHINETSDALGDLFDLNKTIKDATRSWWSEIGKSAIKWLTGGGILAALYAFLTNGGKPH